MTLIRRPRRRPAAANRTVPPCRITAESLEPRVLLNRVQFSIQDPRDTVFDASRDLLYVTTGHGTVERIDLTTMTQLSPWAVGQSLLGADIDANGTALYVAEGSKYGTLPDGLTGGIVHQVNLRTGTVTDFIYPIVGQLEGLAMDVAAAANGKVYVTSQTAGSITALPLVEIDPATGATTRRQDLFVGTQSLLGRSADRRTLVAGTNGGVAVHPAEGTVTGVGGNGLLAGNPVSRDGSLFAAHTGYYYAATAIVDAAGNPVHQLPPATSIAFDPVRDRVYVGSPVAIYDTNTWQQLYTLDAFPQADWPHLWPLNVSDDGARLAAVSQGLVTVIDLPVSDGAPARIDVTGFPSYVAAGHPAQFTVTVRDAGGAVATGYRGTVSFGSSDPRATLPASYTFTAGDAGTHTFTSTLRTTAPDATVDARDLAAGLADASDPIVVHPLSAQATVIVPGRRAHVFDPQRGLLYITTDAGNIERYDPVTQTTLSPIVVGVPLGGIDITPDGSALYVGNRTLSTRYSLLTRVDLDAGVTARGGVPRMIPLEPGNNEAGTYDVAVLSNGHVLFTGESTVNSGVLRELNTATGSVTLRTSPDGDPMMTRRTNLVRAAGRNAVAVEDWTVRATYDVATDAFSRAATPPDTPFRAPVSRDGALVAGPSKLYDRSLNPVRDLGAALTGGAAFDPVRDRLYGLAGGDLVTINLASGAVLSRFAIDPPLEPGEYSSFADVGLLAGFTSVSPDGKWLFLSTGGANQWPNFTPAAVRAIPLATVPVVTAATAATPQFAGADGTLAVRVTARAGDGTTDAAYRGRVRVTTTDLAVAPLEYTFTPADAGVKDLPLQFLTPGRHTVTVTDTATGLATALYDVFVAGAGVSTDGALGVIGSDLADTFTLALDRGDVVVTGAGAAPARFPLASVDRVEVHTFDGSDAVTIGAGVPGGQVELGSGDDAINATAGAASARPLNVLGGLGADLATFTGGGAQALRFDGGETTGGHDGFVAVGTPADDAITLVGYSFPFNTVDPTSGGADITVGPAAFSAKNVKSVTVNALAGNDSIDATSMAVPVNYVLDAGDGNDSIDVGTGGGVDYNAGGIFLRPAILGGNGDDRATLRRPGTGYTSNFTDSRADFVGGPGVDTFTVRSSGTGPFNVYERAASDGKSSATYSELEQVVVNMVGSQPVTIGRDVPGGTRGPDVVVNGAPGDANTITLNAMPAGTRVTVNGGDASDTLTVSARATTGVTFDGRGGPDAVTFVGRGAANVFTVRPDQFGDTTRRVADTSVESISLTGGTGNDSFDIVPRETTSIAIDGLAPTTAPGDQLTIDFTGTQGAVLTTGPAAGQGRFAFSNRAPIDFKGIEQAPDLPLRIAQLSYTLGATPALRLVFSKDVGSTLTLSDLTLKALPSGFTTPSAKMALSAYDPLTNTATITFPGYGAGTLTAGSYRLSIPAGAVADAAGNVNDVELVQTFDAWAQVVGRHAFYNHSALDGNNPAANAADDAAVATDKQALLLTPGSPPPADLFPYLTSYTRGMNGLMIDFGGLFAPPDIRGVLLESANPDGTWKRLPQAVNGGFRAGAGPGGSDRVTLILPDGEVTNTWLRVTVTGAGGFPLAQPDVFYFGNLVGDAGNDRGTPTVNAADLARTRAAVFKTDPASLSHYDFNKDGRIDATDVLAVRNNQRRALPRFTPPPAPPAAAAPATSPAPAPAPIRRSARRSAFDQLTDQAPA